MAVKSRGPGRPFEKGERNPGKRFPKGKSGNPGGRPKVAAEVVLYARERSIPALTVIESVMLDTKVPPSVRITAACAMLDRAWGRPAQAILVGDDVSRMSDAELLAEIAAAAKEATGA
jgi:hypothetical protein